MLNVVMLSVIMLNAVAPSETSIELQWKRISHKQSTRWQHISLLKASLFFSLPKKNFVVKEHNNLYLGLVTPSSGRYSPIDFLKRIKVALQQEDQLDNSMTSTQVKIIGGGVQLEIKRG